MSARLGLWLFVLAPAVLLLRGVASAQYPILDRVANKVIQKYQQSTCEQLWQKRSQHQPPSEQEQRAIQILRNNPDMRNAFINQVAGPIANKMFECGLIP
jgi:hypothetical protein